MPKCLAVCIPTYKRTHLLKKLITDLMQQTRQPDTLIIVDGYPSSGDVSEMLNSLDFPSTWSVKYIPSNHSNLAYQRYLGWKAAKDNHDILLYFDDDLRLPHSDSVEKITAPFTWGDKNIVGVTAPSITGDLGKHEGTEALREQAPQFIRQLASVFGSSRDIQPGQLTASGHRMMPVDMGQAYADVTWLQGRVMAYDLNALDQTCFSQDLFAITHINCGLGEDTFISMKVGTRGRMLFAFCTEVEHPDDDLPTSYPFKARKLAYATAYSRRLLNDHYRGFEPPTLSDRFAFVKSYVGNILISWIRALISFKAYRYAYAWGYTTGAIRGLIQKPTAKNLTPHIDWWGDADKAVAAMQVIQ